MVLGSSTQVGIKAVDKTPVKIHEGNKSCPLTIAKVGSVTLHQSIVTAC